MSTQTADLFLLEDLDENGRASELSQHDREALHAVADWIRHFVLQPHAELGRSGSVCPFMPTSVQRQTMWLAAEQIGEGGAAHAVELMNSYKRRLLEIPSSDAGETNHNVIAVVFTDLSADRAQSVFNEVLAEMAVPSYVEDGVMFGPFYNGNQSTAIYNHGFRPFQSPVPLLFVRHGVVSDWKFFVNKDDWLTLWARRFGERGVSALAAELRHLPWNARRA